MKKWKITVALTLALTMVLGVTLPGLAAPDETVPDEAAHNAHPRLMRGEVDTIGESSFTIQPGDREIQVNDDTRFFKVSIPAKLTALIRHGMGQAQGEQEQLKAMAQERQEQIKAALQERQEQIRAMAQEKQEQLRAIGQSIPKLRAADRAPSLGRVQLLSRPGPVSLETLQLAPNLMPSGQVKQARPPWWNLKWLRQFAEEVEFEGLASGDKVVVWVVRSEEGSLAKMVFILEPTTYKRIAGTVSAIDEPDDGTISVMPLSSTEDGSLTFDYDDNTTFVLRGKHYLVVGDEVVVIYVEKNDDRLAKKVTAGVNLPEPAE